MAFAGAGIRGGNGFLLQVPRVPCQEQFSRLDIAAGPRPRAHRSPGNAVERVRNPELAKWTGSRLCGFWGSPSLPQALGSSSAKRPCGERGGPCLHLSGLPRCGTTDLWVGLCSLRRVWEGFISRPLSGRLTPCRCNTLMGPVHLAVLSPCISPHCLLGGSSSVSKFLPFIRTPVIWGMGPSLMASAQLHHLCEDPISKRGHTLRYGKLGLQLIFCGDQNSIHDSPPNL